MLSDNYATRKFYYKAGGQYIYYEVDGPLHIFRIVSTYVPSDIHATSVYIYEGLMFSGKSVLVKDQFATMYERSWARMLENGLKAMKREELHVTERFRRLLFMSPPVCI